MYKISMACLSPQVCVPLNWPHQCCHQDQEHHFHQNLCHSPPPHHNDPPPLPQWKTSQRQCLHDCYWTLSPLTWIPITYEGSSWVGEEGWIQFDMHWYCPWLLWYYEEYWHRMTQSLANFFQAFNLIAWHSTQVSAYLESLSQQARQGAWWGKKLGSRNRWSVTPLPLSVQQQPYNDFLPLQTQEYEYMQAIQASTWGGGEQQLDDHTFEYQQLWKIIQERLVMVFGTTPEHSMLSMSCGTKNVPELYKKYMKHVKIIVMKGNIKYKTN